MKLRDYQEKAITDLRDGFRIGHKRQVLQLVTGSGKTVIAAHIAKNAVEKGGRVWFVCDNIELVHQTISAFEAVGLDVGVIQGIHEKTDYRKDVQIVTAQTITRRWHIIDQNPQWRPQLIIIDEAHCIYKAHKEMMGMFEKIPFIGLSATPWAKNMGKMYSNLVPGISVAELMDDGYLCRYEAYAPYTPDMKGVKVQAGDYKPDELVKRVNTKEIVGDVVSTWLKLGEDRQTIAFGVNVAHSKAIADEFKAYGVDAEHIDGKTDKDERKEMIRRFKEGDLKILTSVGVLTKGFDAPDATCLIIARPTKSLMLHYQIMGRVLRPASCGTDALILDHSGNLSRLGLPDDPVEKELDTGERKDSKKEKQDEIEKELAAPKPCSACGYLFTGLKCPQCGNEYFKTPDVVALEGELRKLTAKKKTPEEERNKKTSSKDKQAFFSAAISYAQQKGYKQGWAAMQYKDRFGVWPNAYQKTPGEITQEFKNHITAKNIKYAKSHEKKAGTPADNVNGFHTTPRDGYQYTAQYRSDGQLQIKVEKDGVYRGFAKQTKEILNHVGVKADGLR